jgi:uncharacterized membrane protein YqjE
MAGHRDDVIAPLSGGLFQSLLVLFGTLAATARTRVELLGNEVEQELHRLQGLMVFVVVTLILGALALLLGALALLLAVPEAQRVVTAMALALGFAAFATAAGFEVRRRGRRTTRLLAATLGELQTDAERLSRRRS